MDLQNSRLEEALFQRLLSMYGGKKVLMTGGTGFLGKNLVPILEALGAEVDAYGSEYDLTDPDQTRVMFSPHDKYDYIFHAAAYQGAGEFPMHHQTQQLQINTRIHLNVLNEWKWMQNKARFVAIESTCSYPGADEELIEEGYWDGPMHESVEFYGMTKKMIMMGVKAYKQQFGMKGTCLAFATLYGPHDCFDPEKSHVVSALVKKFVDAHLADVRDENGNETPPPVEVWGDGTQMRELIYVWDQCIALLMCADYDGDLLNIGLGEQITIRELAETIKEILGYQGEIYYNTDRFVGVKKKVLNVDKAKELYGWQSLNRMHSLKEGLQKTIDFYVGQQLKLEEEAMAARLGYKEQ